LGNETASIVTLEDGKLTFEVPASMAPGPAVLRLRTSQVEAFPVVVNVEATPPEVLAVSLPQSQLVTASRPAVGGDLLTLVVSGLGDGVSRESVTVIVGGIRHSVHELTPLKDRPGFYELQFFLGTAVPAGAEVELTISVNGRESAPVVIAIGEKP
jgi:uncharacterized protein (TIGR03437 family)